MMRCKCLFNALISSLLILIAFSSHAEEPALKSQFKPKADRNYFSFGLALNEFRSIELILVNEVGFDDGVLEETQQDVQFPLTAQTYALSVAYGTYITENFKTEVRYGRGIRTDTLDGALEINISHWFNWYIGGTYPVTDYMSAYAMYGVSFYEADVTRHEIEKEIQGSEFQVETLVLQPSVVAMEEGLFGTNFSTSWLLGLDFELSDQWFLAFEYGRLLRDTDTNIKVYQAGSYLRYEF